MKPLRKHAKQVAGKNEPFSIKVKVIKKTDWYNSRGEKLEQQMITFQDEEGTEIQSVLYTDSLAELEDTIEDNMEYEISYASVHMLPNIYSQDPDDKVYQLHFTTNTIVDRIIPTKNPLLPNYVVIGSIPKKVSLADRYDVLGIVVYVDPNCKITRPNGETREICEVLIVDQSSEQIMIITAWEKQDIEECKKLQSIEESFPVIAFTALKSTHRKGFSLAFTPKSSLTVQPQCEEAVELRAWGKANEDLLADKSYMVFKVREKHDQRCLITLRQMINQKIGDTMQEEKHWLHVQLTGFAMENLNIYLGCSNCGTGNNENIGEAYTCYDCFAEEVISCPRMALTFEAQDDTAKYTFTALTSNAEKMLQISAADLYAMLPQEKTDYLIQIERQLMATQVYIQVAPAKFLYQRQELMWVLEDVSMN